METKNDNLGNLTVISSLMGKRLPRVHSHMIRFIKLIALIMTFTMILAREL